MICAQVSGANDARPRLAASVRGRTGRLCAVAYGWHTGGPLRSGHACAPSDAVAALRAGSWAVVVRSGYAGLALAVVFAAGAQSGVEAPPVETAVEEPEEINAFVACAKQTRRAEILLDTASRRLHQTVCGAALWFDGLFGERDLDAALKSYGHIELAHAWSEFSGHESRVRFIARTQLPAMQHRLSAFIGVDDEDAYARDRSEGNALRSRRRVTDRETFLVGLGFAGVTRDRFQSDFQVGVRHVTQPEAFVQNRFNYIPYSSRSNRLVLRITPFWNTRDHFGATTHTAFDHILDEAFLLRWSTAVTKTEVAAGTDWRSALILYQNLRGTHALAYEAFIRGQSVAPEPLVEFGIRTVYRRPLLWQERLFGEFVLGYSWPREDPALEREGAVDVGVGLEMPFGKAPK